MRAAFTLALLLLGVIYAYFAFTDLNFLSERGRIGPGFFPQIIGVVLVVLCLYSLVVDVRRHHHDAPLSRYWRVAVVVAGLSCLLTVALHILGALPGMILFMLASLAMLNRGRHLQNLLVGTLLPITIFVMFRYGLHAAMPDGLLGLNF